MKTSLLPVWDGRPPVPHGRMGSRDGGAVGRPVERADTGLHIARSERAPEHVRLGVPSNLPAELSTFVGRADDLERGTGLLGESRLVTFTGAGGCGKTRLARQVAARVAERFPGGVWWVELASLADGALVTERVARALGLQAGETEAVVDYFTDSTALLLLDNCEHIVESVAEFVTAVLRGAGLIRVLATSRHPLGVEGETTWRVPSLAVPPPTAEPASLDRFDAVRLFRERARQARPEVTLTPAVAQICRRLDGIPLALELAAARVGGVAIDRLVDELDDRFRLLTGGSRTGLARHRTLLASVDWSYELLDPRERVLLRRLGVFAGGWTVEAARQVVGFAPLDPAAVLDLLGRLVDKSLAQLDDSGRYFLLETIRAYARAQAAEAGETSTVADHHLAWAAEFAQGLEKDVERAAPECLDLVERELSNIRAALDHAADAPDPDHNGLRLMTALALFWTQRGYAAEGADYSLRVLAGDPAAPPALRARARWAGAYDRFYTFDLDRAIAAAKTALDEASEAGDEATRGRCLHVLAAATFMVDPGASRPLFTSSLELARASGDRWAEADSLQFLGFSHLMQHRPAPAGELLAQSGAMADEMGNAFQQAWQHIAFGTAKADIGELADAASELRTGIGVARRVGDPAVEIWGCSCWALVELSRGNLAELRTIADGMDRPGRPLGEAGATVLGALRLIAADIGHAADALCSLGGLLFTSNDPPDGARMILLGATLALRAGDRAGARAAAERSLAGCEQLGSALAGACRVFLARLDRRDGIAAEQQAHAGLAEITDAGLWAEVPDALELLGGLAIDAGACAEGARLLAAAAALHERMGQRCWLAGEAEGDRVRAVAELGDEFPRIAAEGQRLDGPAAVAYARRARGERRRPSFGWDSLTPMELEVVRLAAAGLTNPAIGERLFISRGTVKTHLLHVFAKLGVHTRAELAAAAIKHGLG
jgi:predicted ATPase/DNA-binding CsgD family transcriptional regulator